MATAIRISSRGTLTLPMEPRRRLRLDKRWIPLAEGRPDGIFLHPAMPVPVRDIPKSTIKKWIKADEADAVGIKVLKR